MLLRVLLVASVLLAQSARGQVTDDFNRTDGDLGANWTDYLSTGLEVVSNAANANSNDVSRGSFYTGASFADDQYAEATLASAGVAYFTIAVRGSGSAGTRTLYQCTVGGSNEYYISEVTNGSSADLETGTTTFTTGDVLRCEAEGTTIRLLIDGAEVDSATDASIASGDPGLEIFSNGVATGRSFDDFEAGDLGGGSAVINPITGRLGQIVN